MAHRYVTFLVDLGGIVKGSVSRTPDTRHPDAENEWKVICDGGAVKVIAKRGKETRVIANARWRHGLLVRRKADENDPEALTEDHWSVIRDGLAEHLPAKPPPPRPEPTQSSVAPAQSSRPAASPSPPSPMKALAAPAVARAPSRAGSRAIVWGAMAAMFAVAGVLVYAVTRKEAPAAAVAPPSPPPVPTQPAAPPPPPPPPEPPLEARIAKAESLAAAFALAKPTMTDSAGALSPGAQLVATYAVARLRWEDVDVAPETSFGHVLKDVDVERGKRMCADGELEAIQRRDLDARKIYVGSLRVTGTDTIVFVAVGATGELIRGSKARFCGAVTGAAGPRVYMIGMFDLPENRTPIVEH